MNNQQNNRTPHTHRTSSAHQGHQARRFQAIQAENAKLRKEMGGMKGALRAMQGKVNNLQASVKLASLAAVSGTVLQTDIVCDTVELAISTWQKIQHPHHAVLEFSKDGTKTRIGAFSSELYKQSILHEAALPTHQGFAPVYAIQKMGVDILISAGRNLPVGSPALIAILQMVESAKGDLDIRFAGVPGTRPTQSWLFREKGLMQVVDQDCDPITASLVKTATGTMVTAVMGGKLFKSNPAEAIDSSSWKFLANLGKRVNPLPSREIAGKALYASKEKRSDLVGVRFTAKGQAIVTSVKMTGGQYAILGGLEKANDKVFATRQIGDQTAFRLISTSHLQMGEQGQQMATN